MVYSFYNKKTGETRDIVMKMSEYKPYKGENGDEVDWERVYHAPEISMNNANASKIDPYNPNSFIEKTGKMKGNYGNIQDLSKELSDKRASLSDTGEDPLKRKKFDEYTKKTGKKHLQDTGPTSFKNKGIEGSI